MKFTAGQNSKATSKNNENVIYLLQNYKLIRFQENFYRHVHDVTSNNKKHG